ncbi:alpha-tocopherol transfer protein-like [Amblyomma americanum]
MEEAAEAPAPRRPKPNLEETARLELGETPETKMKSLQYLRRLIEGTSSLNIPTDDEFLMSFLRARKYCVQEAFEMVKKFSQVRRDLPEFFEDLTPANVPIKTVCHEHELLMVSPQPDAFGRRVALMRLGAWKPSVCSFRDLIRTAFLLAGRYALEDSTQINGAAGIVDLKGLSFHHLTQLTPSLLIKLAQITQDCVPMRIKAVYIVNHPPVAEFLFTAVKPFLKSKLLTRIHFVGHDATQLWDMCPRDITPAEFGGTRERFDYDRQDVFLRSRAELFERLYGRCCSEK